MMRIGAFLLLVLTWSSLAYAQEDGKPCDPQPAGDVFCPVPGGLKSPVKVVVTVTKPVGLLKGPLGGICLSGELSVVLTNPTKVSYSVLELGQLGMQFTPTSGGKVAYAATAAECAFLVGAEPPGDRLITMKGGESRTVKVALYACDLPDSPLPPAGKYRLSVRVRAVPNPAVVRAMKKKEMGSAEVLKACKGLLDDAKAWKASPASAPVDVELTAP